MKSVLVALSLAMLLSVTGCATGGRMTSLRPGMTKQEVETLLGHPDAYDTNGKRETYSYLHRRTGSWSWDKADYVLRFEDGKLVKYGPEGGIQLP